MHNDPKNPAVDPTEQVPNSLTPHETEATRPLGVYVVALVVGLEALALLVMGVYSIYAALTQPMLSVASGVFLIVLLLGIGAGLAAVSVNAFKGMRWTRSAAFVWQLLMAALAVPVLLEGDALLGLGLLIPALAATYYLFTPKVVAFSQRTTAESPVL